MRQHNNVMKNYMGVTQREIRRNKIITLDFNILYNVNL